MTSQASISRAARAEYEAKYTARRNYQMLMEIYTQAVGGARDGGIEDKGGTLNDEG